MIYTARYNTTFGKILIRAAWGPRRFSSRAKAGTRAYPETVTAAHRMWIRWLKYGVIRWVKGGWHIVIDSDKEGHGVRYAKELLDEARKAEEQRRIDDIKRRLPELIAARNAARLNRDFATADAIRDEIVSAGLQVNDAKL